MPELERDAGRLTFKLVYYGPAQGGKTTNLMQLHDRVGAEMKGELMTLETQHDRTLFFDLLPLGFRLRLGTLRRGLGRQGHGRFCRCRGRRRLRGRFLRSGRRCGGTALRRGHRQGDHVDVGYRGFVLMKRGQELPVSDDQEHDQVADEGYDEHPPRSRVAAPQSFFHCRCGDSVTMPRRSTPAPLIWAMILTTSP